LEITAVEYYVNKDEDDLDKKLAGGLVLKPVDPNPAVEEGTPQITGETFIKPRVVQEYHFTGTARSTFAWKTNLDKKIITINVNPKDPCHIKLLWNPIYSG
jgi:hypothetical protein